MQYDWASRREIQVCSDELRMNFSASEDNGRRGLEAKRPAFPGPGSIQLSTTL